MYSTHYEDKSAVAKRFVRLRTSKGKIYSKIIAIDSLSNLVYFNKLVDEYDNIIVVLVKNLLMLIILLWLKKLRQILKLLNLKLEIESELLSTKIYLTMVSPKNWSGKMFVSDSVLGTNPWTYTINRNP